jgi:hypothetical protein
MNKISGSVSFRGGLPGGRRIGSRALFAKEPPVMKCPHCQSSSTSEREGARLPAALMLLYVSRHFGRMERAWGTTQMAKDFPHHGPLETANDFGLALALSRVAPDVVQ